MFMKNLGSRDEGARVLPAPATHALLGEQGFVWRCLPICKMELGSLFQGLGPGVK